MAFSADTARGSAVSSVTHASLAVSPSAALTVGKVVFVSCVSDNLATVEGATTNHLVTDTDGHTWTRVFERTDTDGAAGDGSTTSLWVTKVTSEIGTGDSITNTYQGGSVDAGIIAITEVTVGAGQTVNWETPNHTHADLVSNTAISAALSGLANREYLFYGLLGAEGNDNAKTPLANYTEHFDIRSGSNSTTDVFNHVGNRILTGTGDTWTSNAVTATNAVQSVVAFYEVADSGTQSLTGTLFTKAPTFPVGVVGRGAVALTGTLFVKASTFTTGAITHSYPLTGTLFTKASTFFAGTVTPGARALTGTLFAKAPTLFAGSVTNEGGPQNVSGVLFQRTPTFNVGAVTATYAVTGTLFTKAPTFPVGVVSSGGGQALTGTLFTKAPTFPVGRLTWPTFPIRQQISHFLTGTSISGVLRVAPIEDSMVFVSFSAETTLANMTGPSGYTKAVEEQGDGVSVQLWYKRAGAAESATVTATTSVSVPLRIHVFESPEELFVSGDPLDVVASNDSSTSAVTTLATGTTATVGQADTLAIAAVATAGGNINFLLVNWSDDYTALSDQETRGQIVGFKVMTSATAAAATATWNQASAPTSHKAAAVVATFALAGPVTLPNPSPRRVSFGRIGGELNITGTVDTVATFPVKSDHLYLAFVVTSKDAGNNGNAVIADSHGAALDWVFDQQQSIGTSRRVQSFRALSGSPLSAASISITTPESGCAVWWEVLEIAGAFVTSGSAGAIAQLAKGSEAGATFIETSFPAVPSASNAVVGFCLHGQSERQLIDLDPAIHLLLGEASTYDAGGQQATVDWYQGSDQTFRWDWATVIHGLTLLVEVQVDSEIGGADYPQVASITETPFATTTTDHQVAMPASVAAGDLLLIAAAFDGVPTITNPSGWTPLENEAINSHARLVTAIVANGSEGGTTVNVVTSVAEQGAAQVHHITDWWGTLATGLAISSRNSLGGFASNDTPSLAVDWDVEFTLWIAAITVGTASGNQNVTTYPTDFTNGVETDPSGGGAGAMVASARREFVAVFNDPDAFVLSGVPAGSATRLLAIRPAAPVAGVSQTPNATVSNVGWDTAPLAGQAIHTYIATDDANYITVTVP